jgi:hypothetical protein
MRKDDRVQKTPLLATGEAAGEARRIGARNEYEYRIRQARIAGAEAIGMGRV